MTSRARLLLLLAWLAPVACDPPPSRANSEPMPPQTAGPAREGSRRPAKMVVADAASKGDVAGIVRDAMTTAERDGRRVVVYVGATWCEPCQRFHHAAESGQLDGQFGDVTLLTFDADRDTERLAAAGYAWQKFIPLFALPGPDGRASGKQFEGGIKGEGAVGYLAPRLVTLLSQ